MKNAKTVTRTLPNVRYTLDVGDLREAQEFARRLRRKTRRKVRVEGGGPGDRWTIFRYSTGETVVKKMYPPDRPPDRPLVTPDQWLRGVAPTGHVSRFYRSKSGRLSPSGRYRVEVVGDRFYVGCQWFRLGTALEMLSQLGRAGSIARRRAGSEERVLVGDRQTVRYGAEGTYYEVSTDDLVRVGMAAIAVDGETKRDRR